MEWNEKTAPVITKAEKAAERLKRHRCEGLVVQNEQWTARDLEGRLAKNLDGDRS